MNPASSPGFSRVASATASTSAPVSFAGHDESVAQRVSRVLSELQEKRLNGYFKGGVVWDEIKKPDGTTQAVIHIGNPYSDKRLIKTIPTELTKEQVDKFCQKVSWTREMCRMMLALAETYEQKIPLLIEGESAIGKSFAINSFSKLLSGEKPETFDCNGQTDTGDLLAKPVPNTGGDRQANAALETYLNSEMAKRSLDRATTDALTLPEELRTGFMRSSLSQLISQSGISGMQNQFRMQLGAIPKAMCWKRGAAGDAEYPESGGTGKILHIQEVTLAKGSIINILLAMRGNGRQVANELQLWQDRGQMLHAGPNFRLVLSANPSDGEGFTAREPLDKALLRGVAVLRMGGLCDDSWLQLSKEVVGFSLGNLPESKPENCVFEYYKDTQLVDVIAEALCTFHLEYKKALAADPVEKEKEEKVMASQDDLAQVASSLLGSQILAADGSLDMAETFKEAVRKTYLDRHMDESTDSSKPGFRARMEIALETLIDKGDTGSIKLDGKKVIRGVAMNELSKRASLPAAERAQIAEQGLQEIVAELPDDLSKLLGI